MRKFIGYVFMSQIFNSTEKNNSFLILRILLNTLIYIFKIMNNADNNTYICISCVNDLWTYTFKLLVWYLYHLYLALSKIKMLLNTVIHYFIILEARKEPKNQCHLNKKRVSFGFPFSVKVNNKSTNTRTFKWSLIALKAKSSS